MRKRKRVLTAEQRVKITQAVLGREAEFRGKEMTDANVAKVLSRDLGFDLNLQHVASTRAALSMLPFAPQEVKRVETRAANRQTREAQVPAKALRVLADYVGKLAMKLGEDVPEHIAAMAGWAEEDGPADRNGQVVNGRLMVHRR